MGNRAVKSEKPGGRGVNGSILGKVKRSSNGKLISCDKSGEEGVDTVCMWLARNGLEEYLEVSEPAVHLTSKCQGIPGPVDIATFDQMDDTIIKHVEDGECNLFGGMLAKALTCTRIVLRKE